MHLADPGLPHCISNAWAQGMLTLSDLGWEYAEAKDYVQIYLLWVTQQCPGICLTIDTPTTGLETHTTAYKIVLFIHHI